MSKQLTPEALALLASIGITPEAAVKAQATAARKAATEAARATLLDPLTEVLTTLTMAPSTAEGSTWVGASLSFDVEGYGIKIVVTDKAASAARKRAA